MALYEKFREIVDGLSNKPDNEATTRYWIIDRVLEEVLGYSKVDILPEWSVASVGIPDYTILPGSPNRWLLEAKSWTVPLADQHAIQATTYAYQTGVRWVVLSNGQEWRIYDSYRTDVVAAERWALSAVQEDEEAMEALLKVLQRETAAAGGMDAAVQAAEQRFRLRKTLQCGLFQPGSKLVAYLLKGLKVEEPRLGKVTREQLVACLRELIPRPAPPEPSPDPNAVPEPSPDPNAVPEPSPDRNIVSLEEYSRMLPRRARAFIFPGGHRYEITERMDYFVQVVRYFVEHAEDRLPVPWNRKVWYRLNWEPVHPNGSPMQEHVTFPLKGRTLYVLSSGSIPWLVEVALALCRHAGLDPSTILCELRPERG